MQQKNLITKEKNPKEITSRNVYLMLLLEEFKKHNGAHYPDQYLSVPTDHSIQYLKSFGKYFSEYETALRKFDGTTSDKFTKGFKKQFSDTYKKQKKTVINEALEFSAEALDGREEKIKFDTVENIHIDNNYILRTLKDKAEDKLASTYKLPQTVLDDFERKVKKIARKELMLKALKHVEEHIDIVGKYNFRLLATDINEIYNRLIASNDEVSLQEVDKNLSDFVNQAIDQYEILDQIEYLINKQAYYQAVYNNFRRKIDNLTSN